MNVIEELKRLLATPMSDETFKTKVQALVDKLENDKEVSVGQPDCACEEDCGCDVVNDIEDEEVIAEDDSEIDDDDEADSESEDEELTEDLL